MQEIGGRFLIIVFVAKVFFFIIRCEVHIKKQKLFKITSATMTLNVIGSEASAVVTPPPITPPPITPLSSFTPGRYIQIEVFFSAKASF